MFKKLFILLLISGYTTVVLAQNPDSLVFVNAKWQKTNVAKRTTLITHQFSNKNLFAANQNVSYIVVKNSKRALVFALGFQEKELKTTSAFGAENQSIAALNGTFFDVKNGGSVDYIKVDGKVISTNKLGKNNTRAKHQQAAVVITNGKLSIKKWDNTTDWEQKLTEENVMQSGPLLTLNNVDEVLDTVAFNRLRHPRTCVGIKANGSVILLTADGRNENAAGMSLFELTKIMRWLGCTSAINLDGGGSTTLWINGFANNGVVNYPTDLKKWDHHGERKVANVILLKQKK
jgi:exopolysaccharide biosynthesis protein